MGPVLNRKDRFVRFISNLIVCLSYLTEYSVWFRKYILLCNNEYRVAILLKAMQFTALVMWYEGRCVFHFCCHSLGRHILMDLYEETTT
jgi:hypothetical protein